MVQANEAKLIKRSSYVLSVIISLICPISAICQKFPLWKAENGTTRSVGAGGILILFVFLIVFRKVIMERISKFNWFGLVSLSLFWLVIGIISWGLLHIQRIINDIFTISCAGAVGSLIGIIIQFSGNIISSRMETNKEDKEEE